MANIFTWAKQQIGKQIFSAVGTIVSLIMYAYNWFRPTSLKFSSQSAVSGGTSTISVSFFAIATFLMILSIGVFIYRHKYMKKRGKR